MTTSRERKKPRIESDIATASFAFRPKRHPPSSASFGNPRRADAISSGIRVASTLDAGSPPAGRHCARRTGPVVADAERAAANGRHPVERDWRSPRLARRARSRLAMPRQEAPAMVAFPAGSRSPPGLQARKRRGGARIGRIRASRESDSRRVRTDRSLRRDCRTILERQSKIAFSSIGPADNGELRCSANSPRESKAFSAQVRDIFRQAMEIQCSRILAGTILDRSGFSAHGDPLRKAAAFGRSGAASRRCADRKRSPDPRTRPDPLVGRKFRTPHFALSKKSRGN